MKNITHYTLPLFVSFMFLMSACGDSNITVNEPTNHTDESLIDTSMANFDMDVEEAIEDRLKLDNGSKWIVNSTTIAAIQNMNSNCVEFDGADHVELGNLLMFQVNDMLENCTMTGQGHNQLHVWLLPLIDGINQLQSEDSTDITSINHLLAVFNDFFEAAPEV